METLAFSRLPDLSTRCDKDVEQTPSYTTFHGDFKNISREKDDRGVRGFVSKAIALAHLARVASRK